MIKGKISFHTAFLITILIICCFFIIAITTLSFFQIQKNIIENFQYGANNSEEFLKSSSIYINRGLKLWDTTYDNDLKNLLDHLNDAYERSGRNASSINLADLKQKIDPRIRDRTDLYIINESGVVEFTTYAPDYMYNFSSFPEFIQKIGEMREDDQFISDRIVGGIDPNNSYKKYAYLPTSDHRYLLECSYDVQNLYPEERLSLSYPFLLRTIHENNQNLVSIQLFNSFHNIIASEPLNGESDPDTMENVSVVFSTQKSLEYADQKNQTLTRYIYIRLQEDDAPSAPYMNTVAKLVYSTENVSKNILLFFIVSCFFGLSAVVISVCLAYIISSRMADPITRMIEDINIIAAGDLAHSFRSSYHPDIHRIEEAITQMVQRLRWNIEALQRSESMYRNLFNSSYEAIIILVQNQIIECNQAAERTFETRKDLLLHRSFLSLFSAGSTDIPAIDEKLRIISDPHSVEKTIEGFFRVQLLSQKNTVLYISFTSIQIDQKIYIQVLISDITEEIEMKERESIALAQIEKNMLQQAVLNDQIRNPLAVITAIVDFEDYNRKEEIIFQISRINQIIRELDQGFYSSDKIRNYLMKHHQFKKNTDEEEK